MEKYPKNLFCPAWGITFNGRIVELQITEVSSDKILAKGINRHYKFTYDKDEERWEDCNIILVFDLQCDETQQLINRLLTKETQYAEISYIEASKRYRDSKKEIASIRSDNAEIIKRFKKSKEE